MCTCVPCSRVGSRIIMYALWLCNLNNNHTTHEPTSGSSANHQGRISSHESIIRFAGELDLKPCYTFHSTGIQFHLTVSSVCLTYHYFGLVLSSIALVLPKFKDWLHKVQEIFLMWPLIKKWRPVSLALISIYLSPRTKLQNDVETQLQHKTILQNV